MELAQLIELGIEARKLGRPLQFKINRAGQTWFELTEVSVIGRLDNYNFRIAPHQHTELAELLFKTSDARGLKRFGIGPVFSELHAKDQAYYLELAEVAHNYCSKE